MGDMAPFQGLRLGWVILWCPFAMASPAKPVFTAVLAFAGLATAMVLTHRAKLLAQSDASARYRWLSRSTGWSMTGRGGSTSPQYQTSQLPTLAK
jgi:hypothetical protein